MIAGTRAPAARLEDLIAGVPDARILGDAGAAVFGLAHDSRGLAPGAVFVALRGEHTDGHAFLEQAAAAGAAALVIDAAFAQSGAARPALTAVVVPDTRRALSSLAAAFYGHPSATLDIVGVTGTNGKTTTTYLIQAVLEAAGIPTGRIGTLGAAFGTTLKPLANTTPLSLELQRMLASMLERGARAVAMEVSSHALALDRVADVRFALGALTNVTRDHLDFHATFAEYAAVKRRLFASAERVVLNGDDAHGRRWAAELGAEGRAPLTYGFGDDVNVRATDVVTHPGGTEFAVDGRSFELALPGRFNVHNALAALCVAREMGVDDACSARVFAQFESVPGRMEHFAAGGVHVIVDYAHTPDALANVLRAARETARGRLAVVFGCGGDRDRGKRPQMGRVACAGADRVFLTSDNPRGEQPAAIVADIAAGVRPGCAQIELDRRTAIRRAVLEAAPGDVVLVAGKGHETYQIVGETAAPFDDRDEVRAALAAREAGPAR